jgi:adenine-specific DNA-methyltransferase
MTSKAELIALCKEKSIKGYSGKTKDELKKMLLEVDKPEDIIIKKDLGQYFTTCPELQKYVFENVKHKGELLLEPSFGAGHLTTLFKDYDDNYPMHLYELDAEVKPIVKYNKNQVIKYGDFTKAKIDLKYKTIIGNPPYVKQKGTYNLYIKFIELCYDYLDEDGELIFIVPSDFIKLTSASNIIQKMALNGSFTHFFFPNNETLFKDANVDVVVFRYEKGIKLEKCILNLNEEVYCNVRNGIITFSKDKENEGKRIEDLFDVYVGIVSGKDEVYKVPFGNIEVLTDTKVEKFILINKFPSGNKDIDNHLLKNKDLLLERRIKKFTDKNWFEWGAPRNIKTIEKKLGKPCIYVRNITRQNEVAFVGKIQYFGGSLICLIPKEEDEIMMTETVKYLNTELFKKDYTYSGRFKIGHRQISNVLVK